MVGQTDELMEGKIERQTEGRMNRWKEEQKGVRME